MDVFRMRSLKVEEFQATNEEHLKLLNKMGISVLMIDGGKVQLIQSYSQVGFIPRFLKLWAGIRVLMLKSWFEWGGEIQVSQTVLPWKKCEMKYWYFWYWEKSGKFWFVMDRRRPAAIGEVQACQIGFASDVLAREIWNWYFSCRGKSDKLWRSSSITGRNYEWCTL